MWEHKPQASIGMSGHWRRACGASRVPPSANSPNSRKLERSKHRTAAVRPRDGPPRPQKWMACCPRWWGLGGYPWIGRASSWRGLMPRTVLVHIWGGRDCARHGRGGERARARRRRHGHRGRRRNVQLSGCRARGVGRGRDGRGLAAGRGRGARGLLSWSPQPKMWRRPGRNNRELYNNEYRATVRHAPPPPRHGPAQPP